MSTWMRTIAIGLVLGLTGMILAPSPAAAQSQDAERWFHLYVQQSFPKQTNTNLQIQQINDMFGVAFDDWDDMVNLSVGAKLLWRVGRRWNLGVEVDGSFGQVDGEATVDSGIAGPATLKFVQKYALFANAMAMAGDCIGLALRSVFGGTATDPGHRATHHRSHGYNVVHDTLASVATVHREPRWMTLPRRKS